MDHSVRELRFLQRVALAAAADPDAGALVGLVIAETTEAMATDVCTVYLLDPDGEHLRLAATNGLSQAGVGRVRLRVGEGVTGAAAQDRAPVVVPDVREEPRFRWMPGVDQARFVSMCSVPMIFSSRLIGVINVQTDRRREFSDGDVAVLTTIAAHVAGVLALAEEFARRSSLAAENARLYAAEQRERRTAERGAKRMARLQRITAALSSAATTEEVERVVAREGPSALCAASATLWLGGQPAFLQRADGAASRSPSPAVVRALGAGRPHWPERDGDGPSEGALPLIVRGRVVGGLAFALAGRPGEPGPEERALATTVADLCAQALERARLYEQQRHIAHTLQMNLLPPELPRIPGLEIAARYRPHGEGIEAGGDFYDLFATVGGGWGLVIGDVCGKGPEAAALTALARYTLRAESAYGNGPNQVLRRLNRAMVRQTGGVRFLTAAYAMLNVDAGGVAARIANGGHPPPFLVRREGGVEPLGSEGTLIGAFPEVELGEEITVHLDPGDALVLYTDGVIEAHRGSAPIGEDGLETLLLESAGLGAEAIASRIERAVLAHVHGARDDIAVLVLRAEDAVRAA